MNDPLKKYRRLFRAWKNKRRLKRELHYYSSKFDSLHLPCRTKKQSGRLLGASFPA
ncbi:MAG: hypothetical protein Q7J15_01260 [Candidatus Desulfaltia sp.]|nr:hypothetical protein [Candidatus Desulfaltia sp.]